MKFMQWLDEKTSHLDRLPLPHSEWRNISPKKMLRIALENDLGISRLSRINTFEDTKISVVQAIRPSVDSAQVTSTQGRGFSLISAMCGAVMEAAERHAAAIQRPRDLIVASEKELSANAARYVSLAKLRASNCDQDKLVDWTIALNLADSKKLFVPSAQVYFPFYPSKNCMRPMRPSTSGVAAGSTILEATFYALLEVVERKSVTSFLCRQIVPRRIALNDILNHHISSMIVRAREMGFDFEIFDISEIEGIPSVMAMLRDNTFITNGAPLHSSSAHIDFEEAVAQAVGEAIQSHITAIQGSREDLLRNMPTTLALSNIRRNEFTAFMKEIEHVPYASLNKHRFRRASTIRDGVIHLIQCLNKAGFPDILVKDLTVYEQLPVIKAVIPGAVDGVVEPARIFVSPLS